PRDWPMPFGIVTQRVDLSTNMLATAFCPPSVVGNEYYVSGTEPVLPCNVHTGALVPDSVGGAANGTVVLPSNGAPPPVQDTLHPNAAVVTVPGAASPLRPNRPAADTSRRFRDSAIFVIPPRRPTPKPDSIRRPPKPDTSRTKDF